MQKLSSLLLFVAVLDVSILAQETVLRVYEDSGHRTHVVYKNGQVALVAAGVGQVGIDSIRISRSGHTAGWLVLYSDADSGRPDAGVLVLWRSGKVIRRFHVEQTFWSWNLSPGGAIKSRIMSVQRTARFSRIANCMKLKAVVYWSRGMVT